MTVARRSVFTRLCTAGLALTLSLSLLGGCSDPKREIKDLKSMVQVTYGEKKYKESAANAAKGLQLALANIGAKHPDTLYFAQALSEAYVQLHDKKNALASLNKEIELRLGAGQSEQKLQIRRTTAIKFAEEMGDRRMAAVHALAIAKAIEMGPGKDPQPVYRTDTKYPAEQYNKGQEGDVVIRYSLDDNGSVLAASVVRGTPPDVFNDAALSSFKQWRFTPMVKNGAPVPVSDLEFTVMFRMGGIQAEPGALPPPEKASGKGKKK